MGIAVFGILRAIVTSLWVLLAPACAMPPSASRPFSPSSANRSAWPADVPFLHVLSLGACHSGFHYAFPSDYRGHGSVLAAWVDIPSLVIRWILAADLNTHPRDVVDEVCCLCSFLQRYSHAYGLPQRRINGLVAELMEQSMKLPYGPAPDALPKMSKYDIQRLLASGKVHLMVLSRSCGSSPSMRRHWWSWTTLCTTSQSLLSGILVGYW